MTTPVGAKAVPLAEYQKWLLGIGIYAKDADWGNHDHSKVLCLFKKIWVGIDCEKQEVFSVITDNPKLKAEVGENFDGTMLDKLNSIIVDLKRSR